MSTGIKEQSPTTSPAPSDDKQRIYEAVREIAEKRAVIDQAKGMLMLVYGIDADAAFGLLRWQSQHHNVKLRVMADQVFRTSAEPRGRARPWIAARTTNSSSPFTPAPNPIVLRDVVGDMADRIDD